MRVITGEYGGRHFHPPADKWPTRPTTDISKEGLFNILTNLIDFSETHFLDLFGGTGSHSYEFISRGCTQVDYVDKHRPCVKFVEKTAAEWGFEESITIHHDDVFRYIRNCTQSFNYIFAGPPYPLKRIPLIPDLIFEKNMLAKDGLFVMEHNAEHSFTEHERFSEQRKYGGTFFSFFR